MKIFALAFALALQTALASEPKEEKAPLPGLVSQKSAAALAAEKAKEVAEQARKAGIRSIIKGRNNMRAGRLARSPALVLVGAMQITEGIKSLQAAKEAERMALENAAAEEGMGEVNGGPSGTSLLSQRKTDSSGRSLSGESASRELLSDNTVDAIAEIEEEYGFDGSEFLSAVGKGASPIDIFQKAENGPDAEEARSAYAQAKEEIGETDVALAAAPSSLPASQNDEQATAEEVSQRSDSSAEALRERLRRRLAERLKKARAKETTAEAEEELALSPEVQAALEAKRARASRRISSYEERTIFEQVHLRYRARQKAYYSTPLVGVHGQ